MRRRRVRKRRQVHRRHRGLWNRRGKKTWFQRLRRWWRDAFGPGAVQEDSRELRWEFRATMASGQVQGRSAIIAWGE